MDAGKNTAPVSSKNFPTHPVSVDEFLGIESEVETEDQLHKDQSSNGSLTTETVGTDILSVEAQEVSTVTEPATTDSVAKEVYEVPLNECNENTCENGTDDVDLIDCEGSQNEINSSIQAYDLVAEAADGCKSDVIRVQKNNESNFSHTAIAASTDDHELALGSDAKDGSSHRSNRTPVVQGRYIRSQVEAQEWTHEDHYASESHKRHLSRQKMQQERYERAERRRIGKLMWFGVFLLLLEVAGAIVAVMNYQELVECCGRSIFSENESVGERWNKAFYLIGILYIPVILVIEIPTLVIAQETAFLFNPMVGFLLAMQMIYVTDLKSAYIIFGLEVVAMMGQSMILVQMPRSFESCIHSVVNYTLAGMTIYIIVLLRQQGGYCIVNDRIQSVFSESTCNTACINEDSCFRCIGDENFVTQCFIRFQEG
mmetsp:Transcript_4211/g.10933  ORF Transcript_4211/g.10933 Transcript_4211/m.10933 type:complete len:428 (+) Transcript_4211:168-1451(+)